MNKKINRICGIMVAVATVFLLAGQVMAAQIVSHVEDTSVALRVKNGYTGTVTMVVSGAGTQLVVTCDGLATSLTNGTSYDTITELEAGIVACTNKSGEAFLTVNSEPSLAADSTDEELLDGTYTALSGAWLELLWDTSAHLSFDLYFPSRTYQTGVSAYIIEKILCLPIGTGDVTASVYKDRVLIAQKVITSPGAYIYGASTNLVADNTVNLDWLLDMPFSGADPVIVRVGRATTATTGVISGVIPNP